MGQSPVDSAENPPVGVNAIHELSAELLDRALDGWERFVDTFEAARDE
ncbi:hypothetical protein ACGFY6_16285 [Streptomyces sp. NPDC048387]